MKKTVLCSGDLPASTAQTWLKQKSVVACDLETTGLDWKEDAIASCQMTDGNGIIYVVRVNGVIPKNIIRVVQARSIAKIFHFAVFDLRFMLSQWNVTSANVYCTKVASKLLDPSRKTHSLKGLLHDYLHTDIDKKLRKSDWTAEELSTRQIAYAASDVAHLHRLYRVLIGRLEAKNMLPAATACFAYIPWRVRLEVDGICNVFEY